MKGTKKVLMRISSKCLDGLASRRENTKRELLNGDVEEGYSFAQFNGCNNVRERRLEKDR